jgi:hypothetical protein
MTISKKPGLTKAELAAIEYIGSHRKSDVKVGAGRPVSTRTFNTLQRKRLVMWLSETKQICMLTANGELEWTRLHPSSKYRLK